MNKKIKIFALSAVILTGIEAKVMADKGCVYDCVSKFSKDAEDCKTYYSTQSQAEQCVTRAFNHYQGCLNTCPIAAPSPKSQN